MLVTKILTTGRMHLEPLSASGTNGIFKVFGSSSHLYALPQLSHEHLVATQETLREGVARADGDCWAIVTKVSDDVVGYVSLLHNFRTPRLVFLIHPDFWGRGYAPEACQAVLRYAFDDLARERLEMWVETSNVASLRVAQKLGFRPLGRVRLRDENDHQYHLTMIYGLEASAWRGESQMLGALGFISVEPVLPVTNLEHSVAFYCDMLGFHVEDVLKASEAALQETVSASVKVARGDWSSQQVHLWLEPTPTQEAGVQQASRLHINVLGQLAILYEEYCAAGVTVTRPLSHMNEVQMFAIVDPDGHTLMFTAHD